MLWCMSMCMHNLSYKLPMGFDGGYWVFLIHDKFLFLINNNIVILIYDRVDWCLLWTFVLKLKEFSNIGFFDSVWLRPLFIPLGKLN